LAVDGGNSKIDLALVSGSGELLSLVTGPTISHQQVPMEMAVERLVDLNARAAREAGVGPRSTLGVFCVAGADFPADVRALTQAFGGSGVAERVSVHNDAFAALRAGAPDGWGVVVVCGAGVNAAGIGPDGRMARLAGIGDLSGDWGGGEGIGREALAAAVRARDRRGPATELARRVPERLGVRRPIDVARRIYEGRLSDRRLEELAPLVFDLAGKGDAVARGIVDRLADELAAMAIAIARQLRVARRPIDVVLTGGVFRATDSAFYERLESAVRSAMPHARIHRLQDRPVLGAALLGLDELGARPGGAPERRLRDDFQAQPEPHRARSPSMG
jgi:N-acetylglucosamine kinase-like BadF-type ATPase